ncbi:biopolymer transporter ExbD [Paracoccus sp. DMF-8]|uniref:ExbD/TolR family protein n=1 Tax=Paracoccus sp. DMF-8 TaxID=3019445 RepID=UPI0023E86610|nr:biopolymer transporter ExbD [Paracoccus sp. DMF-8]MDF3605046.1 biopolymer transporter ExbD [Paracoccus sp. DMF-8]
MTLRLPHRNRLLAMDVSLAIVNIVLLLIFFFVVTGQDARQSDELDLSETRHLPLDRLPSPILVIDRQGEWALDGAPITPDLLPVALERQGAQDQLYLIIDRAAPASQLIAALNRQELAGFDIRLVTLHGDGAE